MSASVVKHFDPDDRLAPEVAERVATFRVKAGLAQMLKGGVIMCETAPGTRPDSLPPRAHPFRPRLTPAPAPPPPNPPATR